MSQGVEPERDRVSETWTGNTSAPSELRYNTVMFARTHHRILIVDDEPAIRDLLQIWLSAEGYTCRLASNVDEAWGLLKAENFALAILDIVMPGRSGFELLSMIRRERPDVAVIMVTGVDDRAVAMSSLELGAFGYIVKPFDQNEILINVANALERRRLTLEAKACQLRLEDEVRLRTSAIRLREEEIALRLVWAAEQRDNATGAHIRRIGMYAAVLARELGWTPAQIDDLKVAAAMHDVGKIGVPDRILLKPGRLNKAEFEVVKKHSEIGAKILAGSDVPLLRMAQEIALAHHERWDGGGYPRGLSGSSIPESARLVAVADSYDALIHERIYSPALPEAEALEMMSGERGRQFDPTIFDGFIRILPHIRTIRDSVNGRMVLRRA